jgi:hypothetical protein
MNMNAGYGNPLLGLNPQLLSLLSNPLLMQGMTGLPNPAADQNAALSQMLAQLLPGGGNLNLGYGGAPPPLQQQQQSQQTIPGQVI